MARTVAAETFQQKGRRAEQAVRGVARSPWVEGLARFGYAARGVVYAIIGILAVQAAFGAGGRTTDSQGAIRTLAEQSRVLLVLVAIGLFGYSLWRFLQAALDPEHKGNDPKGLLHRGAMIASGVVYGGLALAAVRIVMGAGNPEGGDASRQRLAADLMSRPFGRWLVALFGVAVIVSGLFQLRQGYTKKFCEKLRLDELDAAIRHRVVQAGQLGFLSRGSVFLIMGFFLIQAAWDSNPGEARGLAGALATLAQQPYGPWLLGLVAVGLVAFGVYSLVEARYRRIYF